MSTLKNTAMLALAAALLDLEPAGPGATGENKLSEHYLKLLEDTSAAGAAALPEAAGRELATRLAASLPENLAESSAKNLTAGFPGGGPNSKN